MAAGANVAMGIPGDGVGSAFVYGQVAVRADPRLVIIGTRTGCGLHVVFDAVFDFDALYASANSIEV